MALNLFPVRSAIGRCMVNGQPVDVMMTAEFARALADLLVRVGGPDGVSTSDILSVVEGVEQESQMISALDAPRDQSAQVAALTKQVAALRTDLALVPSYAALRRDVDDLRRQLGMVEDPAAMVRYLQRKKQNNIVKGTATGSRGANAALASLLTALAGSGLVTDSTTP